jgi:SAM-dependent methyltransferase
VADERWTGATDDDVPGTRSRRDDSTRREAGTYTQWFVSECPNVIALDANREMLRNARARAEGEAHFLQADLGESLPFSNGFQVDLVFSSLDFHYIDDWHALFEEIHDLLREDGYFVYSVLHSFSDFHSYDNSENYFETESVVRSWDEFERPVRVPIYRRPLEEVVGSLLSTGFELERLVEPQPTEELWRLVSSAEHHLPEVCRDVDTESAFLRIRARARCPQTVTDR